MHLRHGHGNAATHASGTDEALQVQRCHGKWAMVICRMREIVKGCSPSLLIEVMLQDGRPNGAG